MVDNTDSGAWVVSGIIDWEGAGFYPAHWRSIKATRNLHAKEEQDWYKYRPPCISPSTFAIQWLVDHTWDTVREQVGRWT